jgi:hypothetical protein
MGKNSGGRPRRSYSAGVLKQVDAPLKQKDSIPRSAHAGR